MKQETTSHRIQAVSSSSSSEHAHSVCPWWLGYVLASPIRRLFEKPEELLAGIVSPGMTVLEPGCGMGFFSIPLARLVGSSGKVVCVDLQPKMIEGVRRRAAKAGLAERVETFICGPTDLGIGDWAGRIDVAVAIHMLHEVSDQAGFLRQVHDALKPGGRLYVREPGGHVSPTAFESTLVTAEQHGFRRVEASTAGKRFAAILERQ
jgi:ubiquinone/menaquinone biosynthesis C-methylase UbiE